MKLTLHKAVQVRDVISAAIGAIFVILILVGASLAMGQTNTWGREQQPDEPAPEFTAEYYEKRGCYTSLCRKMIQAEDSAWSAAAIMRRNRARLEGRDPDGREGRDPDDTSPTESLWRHLEND